MYLVSCFNGFFEKGADLGTYQRFEIRIWPVNSYIHKTCTFQITPKTGKKGKLPHHVMHRIATEKKKVHQF